MNIGMIQLPNSKAEINYLDTTFIDKDIQWIQVSVNKFMLIH